MCLNRIAATKKKLAHCHLAIRARCSEGGLAVSERSGTQNGPRVGWLLLKTSRKNTRATIAGSGGLGGDGAEGETPSNGVVPISILSSLPYKGKHGAIIGNITSNPT